MSRSGGNPTPAISDPVCSFMLYPQPPAPGHQLRSRKDWRSSGTARGAGTRPGLSQETRRLSEPFVRDLRSLGPPRPTARGRTKSYRPAGRVSELSPCTDGKKIRSTTSCSARMPRHSRKSKSALLVPCLTLRDLPGDEISVLPGDGCRHTYRPRRGRSTRCSASRWPYTSAVAVFALCSASPRPTSAGRAGAPSRLEEITTVMASQTLGPYPRLAPSS
jgi:hypothetical protein